MAAWMREPDTWPWLHERYLLIYPDVPTPADAAIRRRQKEKS